MTIREIQEALENKGYSPGRIDGKNGPNTKKAMREFQRACGLEVDGIAGPMSLHRLRLEVLGSIDLLNPVEETEHFAKEEFACDCWGMYCSGFPNPMDQHLLLKLESLRNAIGIPVVITSGVRCKIRNQEVGGVPYSQHLFGEAADLYVPNMAIAQVEGIAKSLRLNTILYEEQGFVHVSI